LVTGDWLLPTTSRWNTPLKILIDFDFYSANNDLYAFRSFFV
jgi:hypothetical protein